jgi:5-methylcytosine-specific restriction endonuclease McrA
MLLTMLADGSLHLTAITLLAPHLTQTNRDGLLKRATHRSKHQIQELIAEIAPRPDVPVVVRKLPERRVLATAGLPCVSNREGSMLEVAPDPMVELRPDGAAPQEAGARRHVAAPDAGALRSEASGSQDTLHPDAAVIPTSAVAGQSPIVPVSAPLVSPVLVQPLSPGRYKVQFTASSEFRDKLERLRALMGSTVPDGDLAAVIEQAVTEKLERLEARRFAQTKAPRKRPAERETKPELSPSSRHIPAAVRRAVRERDGDQCRFKDERGRRCPEHNRLEFHHRHTFGLGGHHSAANVGLVCRAHNAYLADCDYGREAMARHRRPRDPAGPATTG